MSYIEKSEWQWNDIYDEIKMSNVQNKQAINKTVCEIYNSTVREDRYNLNNSESMNSVAKCNEIIDKCAEKAVTTGNHVDFANFYIKYISNVYMNAFIDAFNDYMGAFMRECKKRQKVSGIWKNKIIKNLRSEKVEYVYGGDNFKKWREGCDKPKREYLVQFAFYFRLSCDELDNLLFLAGYSRLYSLDIVDVVVSYHLRDIKDKEGDIESGYKRVIECWRDINSRLNDHGDKSIDDNKPAGYFLAQESIYDKSRIYHELGIDYIEPDAFDDKGLEITDYHDKKLKDMKRLTEYFDIKKGLYGKRKYDFLWKTYIYMLDWQSYKRNMYDSSSPAITGMNDKDNAEVIPALSGYIKQMENNAEFKIDDKKAFKIIQFIMSREKIQEERGGMSGYSTVKDMVEGRRINGEQYKFDFGGINRLVRFLIATGHEDIIYVDSYLNAAGLMPMPNSMDKAIMQPEYYFIKYLSCYRDRLIEKNTKDNSADSMIERNILKNNFSSVNAAIAITRDIKLFLKFNEEEKKVACRQAIEPHLVYAQKRERE